MILGCFLILSVLPLALAKSSGWVISISESLAVEGGEQSSEACLASTALQTNVEAAVEECIELPNSKSFLLVHFPRREPLSLRALCNSDCSDCKIDDPGANRDTCFGFMLPDGNHFNLRVTVIDQANPTHIIPHVREVWKPHRKQQTSSHVRGFFIGIQVEDDDEDEDPNLSNSSNIHKAYSMGTTKVPYTIYGILLLLLCIFVGLLTVRCVLRRRRSEQMLKGVYEDLRRRAEQRDTIPLLDIGLTSPLYY